MAPHTFSEIPILDLNLASTSETRPDLLRQLHHALTSVGFLYVSNHGVPDNIVSDLVAILPQLFSLTDDEKSKVSLGNSPHFLGYSNIGSETTDGKADKREQFEFASELDAIHSGAPLYENLRGPNQWPSALPAIRPIVESYITELNALGDRFLELVAEALSLPPSTFHPFLSDQHRLKLVHYPGSDLSPDSDPHLSVESQGVGPHKDSSGWWTFLLQASPPEVRGLQALNKTGQWIDVPVIPGTFVVNIGQAFEVVTHGFCKATTHRVLSGARDRYSVPFFQGVRRSLTKTEALETLRDKFSRIITPEAAEGSIIDSPFLRGKYETWGESQLRTKIRSHRDVGKRFYSDVFDLYINDD